MVLTPGERNFKVDISRENFEPTESNDFTNIVKQTEAFMTKYSTFAEDYHVLPLALWAIATHTFDTFDCFPYLEITAFTKRSGKTRTMETLGMVCSNGKTFSPDSPASMFQALTPGESELSGIRPTMLLDEAEKLNQENHQAREFLNKGYRKGQTISRVDGDMQTYCPKVFVLIGDIYGTLKDRSIVVVMRRRTPIETAKSAPFRFSVVKLEGQKIREQISHMVREYQPEIESAYLTGFDLSFVNDRDAEIWQVIFSIAKVFCPERIDDLMAACADMCQEKQAPKRKATGDEYEKAEREADDADARIFLLQDMLKISEGKECIPSNELVDTLKAIPVAQWRKYKGRGLTSQDVGSLLDALNVHPAVIRTKGTSGTKGYETAKATFRGYRTKDLKAAAALAGLPGYADADGQ